MTRALGKRCIRVASLLYWMLISSSLFVQYAGAETFFVNPIAAETFGELVVDLTKLITNVAIPIVVIFMMYSGFLFVSARGNEKQLETAKNTFYWTVVGAGVVIGARAIAEAVAHFAQSLSGP